MTRRSPRKNAKPVTLSGVDRRRVVKLLARADVPSGIYKRARALLLLADGWAPAEIPEAVGCGEATVRRSRQRYEEGGVDAVLTNRTAPGRKAVFTKKDEARVIAMVCEEPPKGCARWTIRLIAKEATERGIVESIGKETVRVFLRDHDLKPWREKNVVCAPG